MSLPNWHKQRGGANWNKPIRHIMADWMVEKTWIIFLNASLILLRQYFVQWIENIITSNTKMPWLTSELFSLKQGYFLKVNYCETDVMFHETAGAQWPLPAGNLVVKIMPSHAVLLPR